MNPEPNDQENEEVSHEEDLRVDFGITDAVAVPAWSEKHDQAAGEWLCAKYRPLITWILVRQLGEHANLKEMVEDALRRGLTELCSKESVRSAAGYFGQAAMRVCMENSDPKATPGERPPLSGDVAMAVLAWMAA